MQRLRNDLYSEKDIPTNMQGQIDKVHKTEAELPSFIASGLSPLLCLRNKASHPFDYEMSNDDAKFSLLCFQGQYKSVLRDTWMQMLSIERDHPGVEL